MFGVDGGGERVALEAELGGELAAQLKEGRAGLETYLDPGARVAAEKDATWSCWNRPQLVERERQASSAVGRKCNIHKVSGKADVRRQEQGVPCEFTGWAIGSVRRGCSLVPLGVLSDSSCLSLCAVDTAQLVRADNLRPPLPPLLGEALWGEAGAPGGTVRRAAVRKRGPGSASLS